MDVGPPPRHGRPLISAGSRCLVGAIHPLHVHMHVSLFAHDGSWYAAMHITFLALTLHVQRFEFLARALSQPYMINSFVKCSWPDLAFA